MDSPKINIKSLVIVLASFSVLLMVLTMLFLKYYQKGNGAWERPGSANYKTLNSPWKFKTGDHPAWAKAAYKDDSWEKVDLTAPAGAHDGDVGLSGYMPGWTALGHPAYAGYAWYRYGMSTDGLRVRTLAILAPPAVDDAYQLYVNGRLLGSAGDFSGKKPVAYSIQPRLFEVPDDLTEDSNLIIAFRVWMSRGTLSQGPGVGGIHIAPRLGPLKAIEADYKFQWSQSIKGYIVEVVEPVVFVLLALAIVFVLKEKYNYRLRKWFVISLILLGLFRVNQAVFSWWQIEPAHVYDIVSIVLLRPAILGSWLIAWWHWFKFKKTGWLPALIFFITVLYMVFELLGLGWLAPKADNSLFHKLADGIRYVFLALMVLITVKGMWQGQPDRGWTLLAMVLLSIGLFAQEFALLHLLPGIYFPYGVGVSLTQYVYAGFVLVIYFLLWRKYRREIT